MVGREFTCSAPSLLAYCLSLVASQGSQVADAEAHGAVGTSAGDGEGGHHSRSGEVEQD